MMGGFTNTGNVEDVVVVVVVIVVVVVVTVVAVRPVVVSVRVWWSPLLVPSPL